MSDLTDETETDGAVTGRFVDENLGRFASAIAAAEVAFDEFDQALTRLTNPSDTNGK